jgi:hypothetical protein
MKTSEIWGDVDPGEYPQSSTQSVLEDEIKKVNSAIGKEQNLTQVTFYEGYLKGLRFGREALSTLEKKKDECDLCENHLRKCGKHFYGITNAREKEIKKELLKEIRQIVIEDVPHQYQSRLLKLTQ